MPDGKENEADLIAVLSKKMDDQARFTRMLVVVCCLAVIASMFYSLTSLIGFLPDLVYAKLLGNVESIQREWNVLEKMAVNKSRNDRSLTQSTAKPHG